MLSVAARHDDASAPDGIGAILLGKGIEKPLPGRLTTVPIVQPVTLLRRQELARLLKMLTPESLVLAIGLPKIGMETACNRCRLAGLLHSAQTASLLVAIEMVVRRTTFRRALAPPVFVGFRLWSEVGICHNSFHVIKK